MLSTSDLLEVAKHRQGDVSDYRLAKLLGVPPTTVSNYRVGRSRPANSIAMRLGELAGLDPLEVVAWVNLERASTDEDAKLWRLLLNRVESSRDLPLAA
ncbi:hypothetical protein [Roseateles microcysteis]|uniref:hypothetical protein n=1 Tax=Roseateles microcysteis TaxID=3119057 RepID=UPI002FE67FB1